MVSIMRRMRKLRALLGIRIGPGAAILPPEVTRISMKFGLRIENGHSGPRKFWRENLPRLKYHNPAIPMTVNRTSDQKGPATMTIYFADADLAELTSPSVPYTTNTRTSSITAAGFSGISPTEHTATIDMKYKDESQILAQLSTITKMVPVVPTEEEWEQIKELEAQQQLSEQDSKRMQVVNAERKRTAAILAQARGEMAAVQEA